MKKSILLFTAITVLGYVVLSSNASGPATGSGGNCTGARGSGTTCGGGGCHGGTSANTTASITVDSAGGVHVTQYVPGMTYTVTVAGTNSSALPKFGLQFAAVKGTGSSQTQAGTFSGLPTGMAAHTLSTINFIEHNAGALSAATAGTYTRSFQWVAPAAGTGNVTMYLTINAVNGNGIQDGTDVSNNTSKVLGEHLPTAVAAVSDNISINAFPNPATNAVTLQLHNTETGAYALAVYDISGRCVSSSTMNVSGNSHTQAIDIANWAAGRYSIAVSKDGKREVIPFVKQ